MKKLVLVLVLLGTAFSIFAQNMPGADPAVYTSGIENRQPVDELVEIFTLLPESDLYFFTRLVQLEGKKVSHIWYKNNEEIFQRTFEVGGNSWRVYTSMKMDHFKEGDVVTVKIADEENNEYLTKSITATLLPQ